MTDHLFAFGSANVRPAFTDDELARILLGKYPAKEHCRRLASALVDGRHLDANLHDRRGRPAALLMPGARSRLWPDCDQEQPFRQHRDFFWLTGCKLPDSVLIYDLFEDQLTLVIPAIKPDDVLWSGLPVSKEQAFERYDVDKVLTMDELPDKHPINEKRGWLVSDANGYLAAEPALSGPIGRLREDQAGQVVAAVIGDLRVIKDSYEIALIRKANMVSELAHMAVIDSVGSMKNEAEALALFQQQCTAHAARDQAYDSIVAGGCNAATLHYVKDDQSLEGRELLLLDAGCEVECYASDVTRTYPIRGKWTARSRALYTLVLRMQTECMAMLKPGVVWEDVHLRAHQVAYDGLISELGLLRQGAPRSLTAAFFPHGLGHYLGLDTHDTGGKANFQDQDLLFRYLRVRGRLPANCVITVEPGVSQGPVWFQAIG